MKRLISIFWAIVSIFAWVSIANAMTAAQIPVNKFPLAFGQNAGGSFIRSIPVTSQIGIQNGAASLNDGFPPLTFIPTGAGGVPPFGQDVNGILNEITLWSQWLQAGGVLVPYDSSFSSSIGGYPKGAILASASFGSAWLSTVDNNTSDPDTGGANWVGIILPNLYAVDASFGSCTASANVICATLPATGPAVGGFTGWVVKIMKGSVNPNSGPTTLTVNLTSGTSTKAIIHPDGSALRAGELPASGIFTVVYDGSFWELQSQAFPLATGSVTVGDIPLYNAANGQTKDSGFDGGGFVQGWAITDGSTVSGNRNVTSISHCATGVYIVTLGITLQHGGATFYASGTGGGSSVWGGSGNGGTTCGGVSGGTDITSNQFLLTTNNAGGSGGQRADMTTTGTLVIVGTK